MEPSGGSVLSGRATAGQGGPGARVAHGPPEAVTCRTVRGYGGLGPWPVTTALSLQTSSAAAWTAVRMLALVWTAETRPFASA